VRRHRELAGHGVSLGAVQPPPLVRRATELAAEWGLEPACEPETGRLLHVLAGALGRRRVGAASTFGLVGAAWIVSALDPAVPFVAVDEDERTAAATGALLGDDANVRVLHGDWRRLLPPEAPFDLVATAASGDVDAPVGLLAPRGAVVLADVALGGPAVARARSTWLEHPQLAAVQVLTSAGFATIVAVRRL
jgi:predicted O-methyltransferase YrrM